MSNKKNLLELCMSPDLGGLELYMAKASMALEDEFEVFVALGLNSKLSNYFSNEQKVFELKKQSNLFMFLSAKKLANIIDKNKIDIIHIHWTKDIPFVVLAKLLSKTKPKIAQTRHMTMTRFKSDFYHRFLYKNIDMIIAVTHQVREQLERFIPLDIRPKLEVVYGGCDESESVATMALNAKTFNIGMVGRINKDKGQYLLIEAVDILNKKNLDISAYFVGNPMEESYLDELKLLVEKKGLKERMVFLGFMKEPASFYKACDVIVLASKRETFGLVLVEAMRNETAVIGSNSGGVTEIIKDRKSGLLFEAQNSQSLADAIEVLIKDENLRKTLALNGKKRADEMFSNKLQFVKLSKLLKMDYRMEDVF